MFADDQLDQRRRGQVELIGSGRQDLADTVVELDEEGARPARSWLSGASRGGLLQRDALLQELAEQVADRDVLGLGGGCNSARGFRAMDRMPSRANALTKLEPRP